MRMTVFKVLIALGFSSMLLMNYLANALPFNNRTTGNISAAYPNYFTPAGYAFSIWGLIYLLLGIVVFKLLTTSSDSFFDSYSMTFIYLFLITCLLNMLWLICWHYDQILLSVILMILFLVVLLWIVFFTEINDTLVKTCFSIYAGWISIATIANITVLLTKTNWPVFLNHETTWYIIITITGVLIGLLVLVLTRNFPYIVVFIWAYLAIFVRHLDRVGQNLPVNYSIYNAILLAILVLGSSIVFYLNDFSFSKQ